MKFFSKCLASLFLASLASVATAQTVETPAANEAAVYVYLRCYSTSLKLDDKSLMQTTDGEAYSLGFFADEHILISSGESCVFTVTDVKGKETANTVNYVADIGFLENVVPGDFYAAVPATKDSGDWFRLQYDYFGDFYAVFFLKKKKFGFGPSVWLP